MKPPSRWTLAVLFVAPLGHVLACSCGPAASAPACEKILTADIVFLGTVQAIEPDTNFPTVNRARVYRFLVETAYKGQSDWS